MIKLQEQLLFIADGINVANGKRNSQYILCNYQNSVTLLLASQLLTLPLFQNYLSEQRFAVYQGQNSRIQNWTIKQKLGFLLGICNGLQFQDWQYYFKISENKVRSIFQDLQLSNCLQPLLRTKRKYQQWEKQLHFEWFKQGIELTTLSNRTLRSPEIVADTLGIGYIASKDNNSPILSFQEYLNQEQGFNISILQQRLAQLARGFCLSSHRASGNFMFRSLQNTLPIVLAATIIEFCHTELMEYWKELQKTSKHTTNEQNIIQLTTLFSEHHFLAFSKQDEYTQQSLCDLGLIIEQQNELYLRTGLVLEEWEKECITTWKQTISQQEILYRLQRQNINFVIKPKFPRIEPYQQRKISEIERANLCRICNERVISSPFEVCQNCLFQVMISHSESSSNDSGRIKINSRS